MAQKICLITGASTGIGRGIAISLANAGHLVHITGRSQSTLDQVKSDFQDQKASSNKGDIIPRQCDHSDDAAVEKLVTSFDRLDVLVNNAYAGVKPIMANLKNKYWEIDPSIWDEINGVGLRNHYRCSTFATRIMLKHQPNSGLIVNIGSAGGAMSIFNSAYCVGKEAKDRMVVEFAQELAKRKHNVYAFALWPGAVKTEKIMANQDVNGDPRSKSIFENGESTEFPGICLAEIVKRMDNKKYMKSVNGKIVWTCDLGKEFGLRDVDGRIVPSMLQVNSLLSMGGFKTLAKFVPDFVRIPKWLFVRTNFNKRFR